MPVVQIDRPGIERIQDRGERPGYGLGVRRDLDSRRARMESAGLGRHAAAARKCIPTTIANIVFIVRNMNLLL